MKHPLKAIALLLALLLPLCACSGGGGGEQRERQPFENAEGNLLNICGGEDEYSVLLDWRYLYDKSTGKISLLCKQPACTHYDLSCLLQMAPSSFQNYGGRLLCCVNREEITSLGKDYRNKIYELDSRTGALEEYLDVGAEISSFRMLKNGSVLYVAQDGLWTYESGSGSREHIFDRPLLGSEQMTLDDTYAYVATKEHSLYRVDYTTGESKLLTETKASRPLIHNDSVYFFNIDLNQKDRWELWSVGKNGGNERVVLDDVLGYNIYGDYIYASTASVPSVTSVYTLDGAKVRDIGTRDIVHVIVSTGLKKILIFSPNDGTCSIAELDGSNPTSLSVPKIWG